MARLLAPFLFIGFLGGCAASDVSQYAIEGEALETAQASGTRIEVYEVSLPLYMQSQEIPVMGMDGAIRSSSSALWADDPSRAISLNLAEALSRMSGGVASVEPWPLDEPARARLDVRVKTLLADESGQLQFAGQYFMVSDTGRRPKVEWFDIKIPIEEVNGKTIAQATGLATQQLARQILGMKPGV